MQNRRPTLLICASKLGYQTEGFVAAAKSLEVEVRFATDRCHKLDDPWGDGALPVHFENPQRAADEIVKHFAGHPPNAVLALGDRPTVAAAYAARALGLPGNPPESAERCRNKFLQRQTLSAAGLPIPGFFSFRIEAALEDILTRVEFPCVVKPLSLAASQGVMRADNAEQFRAAALRIRALLESPEIRVLRGESLGEILVEKYIPGREVALEGLLENGKLRVLAIFDKPDPLEGPFFEETIYVTPSRLPPTQQQAIEDCAARATAALGLVHGPLHAEFRINDHGPWVLELAPRPIGGLCARALRFGESRMSLEELLLRQALNLRGWEVEREPDASGVMMIPVPRGGIFEGVENLDAAVKFARITQIQITARVKDYLAAWPEGSSYLGFIFASAAHPEEAEAALRNAHALLKFNLTPRLAVEHPITGKIMA